MTTLSEWLEAQIAEDERRAGEQAGPAVVGEVQMGGQLYPLHGMPLMTPARVLAECNAKRRIIELHAPVTVPAIGTTWPAAVQCDHCARLCHSTSGLACDQPIDAAYPCDTVRLLAPAFEGRPGYQETWKP